MSTRQLTVAQIGAIWLVGDRALDRYTRARRRNGQTGMPAWLALTIGVPFLLLWHWLFFTRGRPTTARGRVLVLLIVALPAILVGHGLRLIWRQRRGSSHVPRQPDP
jgi:hypothetical protein